MSLLINLGGPCVDYESRCCSLGTKTLGGLPGAQFQHYFRCAWCARHIGLCLEKILKIRSSERAFLQVTAAREDEGGGME